MAFSSQSLMRWSRLHATECRSYTRAAPATKTQELSKRNVHMMPAQCHFPAEIPILLFMAIKQDSSFIQIHLHRSVCSLGMNKTKKIAVPFLCPTREARFSFNIRSALESDPTSRSSVGTLALLLLYRSNTIYIEAHQQSEHVAS